LTREARIRRRCKRIPIGRVGQPEEVAQAVVMIVGNGTVTGQTVQLNGGALFHHLERDDGHDGFNAQSTRNYDCIVVRHWCPSGGEVGLREAHLLGEGCLRRELFKEDRRSHERPEVRR
jgi:hypothetical protein